MKALLADDSLIARRLLDGVLKKSCGVKETVHAEDGQQALDLMKSNEFDLILLDWNMPNMQGIDVLKVMRSMGNKTPVIMVTSEMDRTHVRDAIAAGANSYVIKPFHVPVLVDKIKKTMDRYHDLLKRPRTLRALVTDDSSVSRKVAISVLRNRCGFKEVDEADDGAQAIELLKESTYDILLLDWNMPKMSGIDALRAIRAMGDQTPVIMVTSEKEQAHIVEAFDAGANNYLIKPFQPSELAERIEHILHAQG